MEKNEPLEWRLSGCFSFYRLEWMERILEIAIPRGG